MSERALLFSVSDLRKYYPLKREGLFGKAAPPVRALDGVTLSIYRGETLGLVGESGCGKSTLGRTLLQLLPKTAGTVRYYGHSCREFAPGYLGDCILHFEKHHTHLAALKKAWEADPTSPHLKRDYEEELRFLAGIFGGLLTADPGEVAAAYGAETGDSPHGESPVEALRTRCRENPAYGELEAMRDDGIDLARLTREEMRRLRREMQMIFQDPYSSLNPRMTAGQTVGEGLLAHGLYKKGSRELEEAVHRVLTQCGLAPYLANRFPHQFSGGQRQRIGIARALAPEPGFLVCDEAVSALDVSIQAQILNLLEALKKERGLTYLFISHDLSVVRYLSDRIGVMYLGGLVELAETAALFESPLHPYTRALLSAIPGEGGGEGLLLAGELPSPAHPPEGCKFHPRCPHATAICATLPPVWEEVSPGHFLSCHNGRSLGGKTGRGVGL